MKNNMHKVVQYAAASPAGLLDSAVTFLYVYHEGIQRRHCNE